ncbi:hypothetical protein H0H93_005249 [Arthromyces matolae]|nr:hypothetical protein H0H93_005249 [Arthromyces matolae]
MPKITPVFARNITSLALVIAFEIPNLSYPLLALGGTLETLVVHATGVSPAPPSPPSITFPVASATRPAPSLPTSIFLPKGFPNLRHLSWNHEGVDTAHLKVMKKLFSCFDDEAKTPLKSLHLTLRWTFAQGVVELLSIRGEHSSVHLGARLTTLHLHLRMSEYFPIASDVAVKVLQLCSNLVDFYYEPPFSKTALELFPLSLQRLHLVIYSHEGIWFEDIAEFLRSNQLPELRIFRFNTRQPLPDASDAAPVLDPLNRVARMRFRTLEIRWHDSKPISSCDFQPVPFKKARPGAGQDKVFASQAYRLATAGEDNHVRLWMVHPNIRPSTLVEEQDAANAPRPPRVEYLATLSRHSAAVNVVRFSPNGDLIASAGDDGMIIIWSPSATPQASTYGSDLTPEEMQHEKEYWKPRTTFRCTTMQVYDLAWSPNGEYIIAGSTDNTARVFSVSDGKTVHEIAEHSHYVQGVAWDPLNEYIATQSSDRSMHIYRISTKGGVFEAHAVGKNTRMPHRHSRTPSVHGSSRPPIFRSQSIVSDSESVISDHPETSAHGAPLTPATSIASTSSMFPPPPAVEAASSRRSSFSSNAPGSPATYSRYGRSPSPMPPLPAIRAQPSPAWSTIKLYGDESHTNFFRRLTFSPDGALLLTPAGQFEDPSVIPLKSNPNHKEDTPVRGRKGRPTINTSDLPGPNSHAQSTTLHAHSTQSATSSVYIYSRANFARPPVAQLPGHKKASVAVRFSPILFDLRPGVEGPEGPVVHETKTAALERGSDGIVDVDVAGPVSGAEGVGSFVTPQRTNSQSQGHTSHIVAPSPRHASIMASPAMSPLDLRPPTPAASKPPTPTPNTMHTPTRVPPAPALGSHHAGNGGHATTASVFTLPYRMLYAVLTMDTVTIYDTQQAGPVCLLTKLHYDEFTDASWSPDGQCLIVSSRDGYCTLVTFDEILSAHHIQQHTLQLQSIAHHHSVPIAPSPALLAHTSPSLTPTNPRKRPAEPPLTPAASVDGGGAERERDLAAVALHPSVVAPVATSSEPVEGEERDKIQEPPKKKRRVALTRVGDLDS